MSRTRRALAMLVLSLTLFGATTAAVAAPSTPSAVEDQNDRLLRNIEKGTAAQTRAAFQAFRSMERNLVSTVAAPPAAAEDQNDRLLRGIEKGTAARTQAAVEAFRSMERNLGSPDAATSVAVEDQNDRLLRGIEAAAASRTQAAFELARSTERNLTPVAVDGGASQLIPQADAVVPPAEGNGFAALLFGLVGGLIGGVAVLSGRAAVARRRLHRAVPAS
jgi:hypothetical protein